MKSKHISPSSLRTENRNVIVSLIIGYDLLHHQDIKAAFKTKLKHQDGQAKLTRGCWDIVLVLCEAYLTETTHVISDICAISALSESTTRRALKKLESLQVIERDNDNSDRRRHFIRLSKPYRDVVNLFVSKCAEDFKTLIELNDKRERIRAIEAWLEAETKLQLVVDSVPALISYVDKEHRYVFNNSKYVEWFGQKANSLTGKYVADVVGNDAYNALFPYIKAALSGNAVRFELEIPYRQEKESRYILANYIPDISPNGEVKGFVAHILDITEQKRNNLTSQK